MAEEVSGWPSEQRAIGSMGEEACNLRKKMIALHAVQSSHEGIKGDIIACSIALRVPALVYSGETGFIHIPISTHIYPYSHIYMHIYSTHANN
jgi:hypothetical protein